MQYITARQMAKKWNISQRRVQYLCSNGRITGVVKIGEIWAIPNNVSKPDDARIKRRKSDV